MFELSYSKSNKYVVAIDFGTSRTGFAWSVADTSDTDKIYMCVKWPSIGPSVPKTNSAILLNEKGEMISWGFDAIRNYDPKENYFFDRVKMDLYDADSNRSRGIKIGECPENGPYRIIKIENGSNITEKKFYSKDLIAMILSVMKDEAINSIYSSIYEPIDKSYSKDDINKLIKWVLTVPASATDAQKYLMRKSAIKAGLISSSQDDQENLLLAYEPEMAALYYHNRTQNTSIFEKEHVMVVVDAGGGTVDVSAHKFNPKIGFKKLDQVVMPRKSNAGSTYLDSNFKNYLSTLFSKEIIVAFSKENKGEWHDFLFFSDNSWETIKRNFTPGTSKVPIYIRCIEDFVEDNFQYQTDSVKKQIENINRHRIMLSEEIFSNRICSPVFLEALKPVQSILLDLEMKNLKCDVLFFAGGLSCSQFFVEYIKWAIRNQVKTFGDGLTDVERESAILKGAVLFGNYPNKWFGSRISQWTYGVNSRTLYDERLHTSNKAKIVIDHRGDKRVENGFKTYINKEQSVKVEETFRNTFFPIKYDQKGMFFRILASTKKEVIYSDEMDLIELDNFNLPISGEGYDRAVDLSMKFGQTEIKVTCWENSNPNNKIEMTLNFPWTYNKNLTTT